MVDAVLIAAFVLALFAYFLLGVPVAYAIGLASLTIMLLPIGMDINYTIAGSRIFQGMNSFVLLAIPFFMLAGRLMNEGGATEPLFDFARALVGDVRAATGHVNIVASMIFSGMTGVAVADAAGLGTIEYKAMKSEGYDDGFSVAITGSSSIIGPIIPPSLPLILYGILAGVSIGQLFIAGIVPGIIIGISLMLIVTVMAHRRSYPGGQPRSLSRIAATFRESFPALLTPVIIIGGIMVGVFTPTESAVVASVYALAIGLFWYEGLTLERTYYIFRSTFVDTAALILIVGIANFYGYLLVIAGIPQALVTTVLGISTDPLVVTLLLVGLLLVIGTMLETIAALTVFVPVLMPVIEAVQIDPVYFGIVMVLTLMIGLLTPPFGVILFVLERITDVSVERIVRAMGPFYVPLFLSLLVIVLFPKAVMWLPRLFV
ncbi:TRAP transporter large permease [Halosimplex halobium]|uniref:TRAP transporter large permease n=1 Tax=Halosimplex halobium TaxID=3396618 RepID=UPI003F57A0E0